MKLTRSIHYSYSISQKLIYILSETKTFVLIYTKNRDERICEHEGTKGLCKYSPHTQNNITTSRTWFFLPFIHSCSTCIHFVAIKVFQLCQLCIWLSDGLFFCASRTPCQTDGLQRGEFSRFPGPLWCCWQCQVCTIRRPSMFNEPLRDFVVECKSLAEFNMSAMWHGGCCWDYG